MIIDAFITADSNAMDMIDKVWIPKPYWWKKEHMIQMYIKSLRSGRGVQTDE